MVREESEDYLVFVIPELGEGRRDMERFLAENGPVLAQVISSNTKELSAQQQQEELSGRIAYYTDDLTIVTWNAALVCGVNMDDVLTVLELANVQLRELRCLDDQLDDSLQESYEVSAKAGGLKTRMTRIRELMLDGQAFSEAVTNAFKPFPDAFLARVYSLASRSLGLERLRPERQGQAESAEHALHDPFRRGRARAVGATGVDRDRVDLHRDHLGLWPLFRH